MIPSKPRLVVPYGLKTLLEGVSRAILRTNPPNITQFAALYFKELILFRDANSSLDIKDLVKEFHQIKVEKWSEGREEETKAEDKVSREVLPPPAPPLQPTPVSPKEEKKEVSRQEKSTDTEEDNMAGPLYSNKTTQFPSFHAEVPEPEPEPEERPEAASSPKPSSPPPSPSPPPPLSAASPELVYVPADPAQLAAQMLAMAASEAGQPPPYSNMWTLYCLTDLNQPSHASPPPPAGAPPPPQPALYLANAKEPQSLQLPPKVTSPTYVMLDDGKRTPAPPFILVGSNRQEAQDWKPLPGHAVLSQPDATKRFAAVQVPVAVPADPGGPRPPRPGPDGPPRPQSPVFLSVAIPLEDVKKKGSGSGDGRTPFAGSYGIAGEITVTTTPVRRADT
ncbi:calcium-binding tyrosine phosphorylation-regulated protein isoform X2 [Ornithorhynchus anatinus]|uniref:Calcium-binding tyrosine phosphorylation-regulated protein n=1 Tax=Ornithorhynchus anatinus TaxID=9258 RepID=K7EAF6_ORNAN|nr:calcium-binding tyrosine phosphorylation-regulated protein isoform X2 [Ornithorhynchus anatinus]